MTPTPAERAQARNLTDCTACQGRVAREAPACPHCGQPRGFLLPRDEPATDLVALAIGALFWVWQAAALFLAARLALRASEGFTPAAGVAAYGVAVDLVLVWGAGSVALAACRWMAR